MNEQDKLPEWIDRFNNNDLHGNELKDFLELMNQNPELRSEVKLDKELNETLADTDIIELRKIIAKYKIPEETNHIRLPIFFLAASITILIGLGIFVFIWMRQDNNTFMKTAYPLYPSDTSIFGDKKLANDEQAALNRATFDSIARLSKQGDLKTNDKLLLTDNYKPYPPYESMVGEVIRTTNFKLIKPSVSDTFAKGSVMTFSWEGESFVLITITITDNKGKSLFVSRPIDGKKFLFNTSKLAGGLYYVKFINNDEIVYFGKFTLK
jgi:hypothetical protein